jgi:polyhydroxyalkanoate synthesis regulator phasin
VDEEIERRIEYLIDQNELPLEEAHRIREKLLSLGRHLRANSLVDEQHVEQILAERNVPSREEIQRLSDRIEDLSAMIDDLKEEQDAGG